VCREWNPTIPKQPSGDFREVVDIEDVVLRMLRQRIWRVLMGLLGRVVRSGLRGKC
jgi:hypothetical protein